MNYNRERVFQYGRARQVTVDEETGQITVDRITDAHDCGLAINVTSVEGQMEGSVSMGLGEALFEEVKFDSKGHVINADLAEYKIPTVLDMPQIQDHYRGKQRTKRTFWRQGSRRRCYHAHHTSYPERCL